MSWADWAIKALSRGERPMIRPRGGSMSGRVESGQPVTLAPVAIADLNVGDIVLCKVRGTVYLHLVKAKSGGRVQIGNNKGRINGWTRTVFGRVTHIDDVAIGRGWSDEHGGQGHE